MEFVPRPQNSLQHCVCHYIREQQLMGAGDRVGVAVSGGADSVALLRLLIDLRDELGIVLSVVHVNHCLRGAESDEDQRFVQSLADQVALPVHLYSADVAQHAVEQNLSLEAAGRELRLKWFSEVAGDEHLDSIATGHTLDDQAETVLLKLLRGAWTRGLAGIFPAADLRSAATRDMQRPAPRVVRPLLALRRSELREYLNSLGQPWREDRTNQELRFTRNRIRHELLPLLESDYNPAAAEVLSGFAEAARAEEELWAARNGALWQYCECTANAKDPRHREIHLNLDRFAELHTAEQRRLIKSILDHHAPDLRHIEMVRRALISRKATVSLPGSYDLTVSPGGELVVKRRSLNP